MPQLQPYRDAIAAICRPAAARAVSSAIRLGREARHVA